ncbi:hypothetical protein J1781_17290 [Rahnella sp. C60]|nr:hypothetical protein [Rahnella perminowiae]
MELQPQFNEFLGNIRPTDNQKADWKSGAKTLRDRLKNFEPLQDIVVSTFLQGSIRRSTAIRPLGDKRPDVDRPYTDISHRCNGPVHPIPRRVLPGKMGASGTLFWYHPLVCRTGPGDYRHPRIRR